ncbi:hypothetical protein ABLA30_06440 [Xenorhabdus nematophila]|uniref:hypothetical protein n=1 Tax=Xenorhabdus nematophila TaxID=628 RepID=UPI00032754E0|nr:hypothetical protein [Xenorhabdus nematophila]CCW32011.1 conserved hypothetical protein [Xenorhabdus nematophila F1]
MYKGNMEKLMIESGFTPNDIKFLESINKKNGTNLMDNIIDLDKRFYKLIFIVPLVFLGFAFLFLIADDVNVLGFIISIIITIPPILFMLSFRMSYRASIFMKKYKRKE